MSDFSRTVENEADLSSLAALVKLLRYATGHRKKILLAICCSIINKIFDVMPEILIGIAIDLSLIHI